MNAEFPEEMLRNDKLRLQILQFYTEQLELECGLNWFDVEKTYGKLGGVPGVYPDTLLMMLKLVKYFELKEIVEVGSGFSTLFFAKLAHDLNIKFKTYEENAQYLELTINLLEQYASHFEKGVGLGVVGNPEELLTENTGLLFLDCQPPLRREMIETYEKNPNFTIPFIIIDDFYLFNRGIIHEVYHSYRELYIYNGMGRLDRQQAIIFTPDTPLITFLTEELGFL